MADLLEGGDDGPRSRRGPVAVAVVAVLLGGYAVSQHLSASGAPPPAAAPASRTAPPETSGALPGATVSGPPPGPAAIQAALHAPWAALAQGPPPGVDLAVGNELRLRGRAVRLAPGAQVISLDEATRGPVAFVQDRGTLTLEQLRRDGSRLVVGEFPDESHHPQGVAVDPNGRQVAFGLTAKAPDGPYGIEVRDLATGALVAARSTRLPFAVRDWTSRGVVLAVTDEPGGPPYVWRPGAGQPVLVTPRARAGLGPFLLASSPVRAEWALTSPGCVAVVRTLGQPPAARFCRVGELRAPAAWSPDGRRVVALRGVQPWVLDTRTGTAVPLDVPLRVYVGQLVWEDADTVLVSVETLTSSTSAVLRCTVGGSCLRTALPARLRVGDIVLAR